MSSKLRAKMLKACKNPAAGFFDDDDYGKIRDYIDTGSAILNTVISGDPYKGIPSGKIIQMAGMASTGKSFVCLETIRRAQEQGYFIIYYDSESATDQESIISRGIDPSMLLYVPIPTVEELTTSILNILEDLGSDDRVMIVIDSLGNLSSTKELEDSTDGKGTRDMTRAQKLKALFRTITVKAGILNVPIMAVNHQYAAIGSYFGGNVTAGGCLTEKMNIKTPKGICSIKDVQLGDLVDTMYGPKTVISRFHYTKPINKIKLSNGDIIEATSEHRFLIENENGFMWKQVSDLSAGDELIKL